MKEFRVGIGWSRARKSAQAGREAARMAVAALAGEAPSLVIVFTAPRYNLAVLPASIRSETGSAQLVGETSSGELVGRRYMGFGAGVSVLAMSAGPYRFGVASAGGIGKGLDGAGSEIARKSKSIAGESPRGILLRRIRAHRGGTWNIKRHDYRAGLIDSS